MSDSFSSSHSDINKLEQGKRRFLELVRSEGTVLVSDLFKEIDLPYMEICRIAFELRDDGLIVSDQLLGRNAVSLNKKEDQS